eukprot:03549.XXX_36519_29398_1 [CDS] Oithona nana genome sequencing.
MWIYKAVFAVALVLLTAKAQELEETEGARLAVSDYCLRKKGLGISLVFCFS